jgi:diguanylate cyclase
MGWYTKISERFTQRGEDGAGAPAQANDAGGRVSRLAREERKELLKAIGDFLMENDLAVQPDNLVAAYNALSGSLPALARRIDNRKRAGEPITQAWLDEVAIDPMERTAEDEPNQLMEVFDNTLEQFSRNTRAVRKMTREYGSELDRSIVDLDRIKGEADILAQIALLAQTMSDRTRKAESELREREQEANALRRRLDHAKREAYHDHLTGLPNRRAFEARFDRAFREAAEAEIPLSLAFCDIDRFKLVNDQHGHDAGDRVLKLVAEELAAESDDNCHVARHGGEEFVLLFQGLSVGQAKARLDQTREALSRRRLVNRETQEPIGQITFSAGVADVFAHDDPRLALRAADEALLRAKESGRNQVLMALPVPAGRGKPIAA